MRLTKDVISKILTANEGFSRTKSWSSRNFKCDYNYLIENGKLLIREVGKTSWADSRFDDVRIADIDQTRRFLREFLPFLKTDNL
ncbi:MAG: hypothetical protein Q4B26_19720 [Eubacteriales bacterium]|nr:hypothetical protein [Eubacteriales bacterium]